MKPIKTPQHEEARKHLLQEGARSYVAAVTALIAYQQEVQKTCRDVIEGHIEDYGRALKIPLRPSEIKMWAEPDLKTWQGDWASLAAGLWRGDMAPSVRSWYGYCCLGWQLESPQCYCWVGERYGTRAVAKTVFDKSRRLNPKVTDVYEYEIGLIESLSVEEAAAFGEKLDALFEQWIKLWKKVGGTKAVFHA